jgi:hypothetical protein
MHAEFWLEGLMEKFHLGYKNLNARIVFKGTLREKGR